MSDISDDAIADAIRRIRNETQEELHAERALHEKARLEFARRAKSLRLAAISVALLGVLASTTAVTYQFFNWDKKSPSINSVFDSAFKKTFATADEVDQLRTEIPDFEKIFSRAKILLAERRETDDSPGLKYLEFSALESSVSKIDARLTVLERSIADNPEKALSIPMLRKDQENMEKSIEANKVALTIELNRIYELQKWILGGIGTVLFAAVTALLSALYNALMAKKDV